MLATKLPNSLRTESSERLYQKHKELGLTRPLEDETPLIQYRYWILIPNRYPYDEVYKDHDMLIPKRTFANRSDMTLAEYNELNQILDELSNQYDLWFENFAGKRSIQNLWHCHLVTYKKREER